MIPQYSTDLGKTLAVIIEGKKPVWSPGSFSLWAGLFLFVILQAAQASDSAVFIGK
jgi:hypothetical protein